MKTVIRTRGKGLDYLFLVAWIFYIISVILDVSVFTLDNSLVSMINKGIRYIVYGICLVKVLISSYRKNDFLYLMLFLFVFALSFLMSRNKTMVFYSIIMLASYGLQNDRTIRTTAITQGILLFSIIALSQTGIILDYIFDKGTRERHSLGFVWTTTGPIIFFYFIMSYAYINRRKLKWSRILFFEGVNYWLYRMTNTRLVFALTSLFLAFILLEIFNKKRFKFLSHFKLVYIAYPFLMWIFVLVVCKLYNRDVSKWVNINNMLTGRLTLSQDAINHYGINLLGHNVEWRGFSISHATYATGEYNYVDSSYLQLTINYGVILMIAVLFVFSYAIYKHVKANDYYTVMIYIFILTLTLTEPQLMNFAFNPFSLLAFGIVAKDIMTGKYIHRYKRKWKLGAGEAKQTT